MKNYLLFAAIMAISTTIFAKQATSQLIIDLKEPHPMTGTDAPTTNYPRAIVNTMPIKNTGTETNSQEQPKPGLTAPPASPNSELPQ